MIDILNPILYPPDNRVKYLDDDVDYITVGGTTEHTFIIPLHKENIESLHILYRYGLDVVIDKIIDPESIQTDEDDESICIVKSILEPEETLLFKDWYRDAEVQLKFGLTGDVVLYSDIYCLKVYNTLR